MALFLRRSRGSITVLVALILVPTIFFTGFLVDLSRLKLYGNQAVMTADNYAETVLTQYDNLLKELYGLFAVTQDTEAIGKLDELQDYIKSSFAPSENTISWSHLQAALGETSYDGFMPYQSASVALGYEFIDDANLRNHEVFSTQIGDFMKFRIVQQVFGDGFDMLDVISEVQDAEDDAKAIEKKLEIEEKAQELFELAKEYYDILKCFAQYPDYIRDINGAYAACRSSFSATVGSGSYEVYYEYETNRGDEMDAAVARRDEIEAAVPVPSASPAATSSPAASPAPTPTPETLSDAEQALVDIYDAYMDDENAREDKFRQQFSTAIATVSARMDSEPIDFENFVPLLDGLAGKAEEIIGKSGEIQTLRAQLQGIIDEGNVSDKLRDGIRTELQRLDDLFGQIEWYRQVADFIRDQDVSVNEAYRQQAADILAQLEEIRDAYLLCEEVSASDWPHALDVGEWRGFSAEDGTFRSLYGQLKNCFERDGSDAAEKKSGADQMLQNAQDEINEEDAAASVVRDIPENFGYGASSESRSFNLSNMAKEAAGYFSFNHFLDEINKFVLKIYMTSYDFGMFTSRTTNIDNDGEEESGSSTDNGGEESESRQVAVSLTGYEKTAKLNYLYQAELEYILGGSNSSQKNLDSARNKILAFRAIFNFAATYSVDEINNAINEISEAAMAVNPILGIVVNGALRLAVAGVETAADWKELKKGEAVRLMKSQLKHMTAYDTYKDFLGCEGEQEEGEEQEVGGEEEEGFKVTYDQYLVVIMIFLTSSDDVAERTANLIELNVNTAMAQPGLGEDGILSELIFKMEDAHTAVNATCTVHLDFAVMPKGFARSVITDESYSSLEEFERNSYKFTVTRGY